MKTPDPNVADAFPVKVEAIVAFVRSPDDAFRAITRHARESLISDPTLAEQLNEGVKFSFSYGGVRHDVTMTRED